MDEDFKERFELRLEGRRSPEASTAILPFVCDDANWPNGMMGRREIGHGAIRASWRNQWSVVDSTVTPHTDRVADGRDVLEVRQLVRDLEGGMLSDGVVFHVDEFSGDQVARMDIHEELPGFAAAQAATPTRSLVSFEERRPRFAG